MKEDRVERMRQAYLKVEALSRSLRERVAGVPSENLERWIPEMGEQFEAFRAHCVKHMSLEEADGYMTSVVDCRPGLSCEVDRLQHEHKELVQIFDSIHRRLKGLTAADRLLVRECCHRINSLLDYIDRHEKDENLLLTSAFTQDIGSSD